jgi:hypothetical protein
MKWLYRLVPFSMINWFRVWSDLRTIAIDAGMGTTEQTTFNAAGSLLDVVLIRQGETDHIWSTVWLKNPGLHAIQMATLGDYDSKDDTLLIMRNGILTEVGCHFDKYIKDMIAEAHMQANAIRAKQARIEFEKQQRAYKQRKEATNELSKAIKAKLSAKSETKAEKID